MTEESGGEEILYPRKHNGLTPDLPIRLKESTHSDNHSVTMPPPPDLSSTSESNTTSPPSAFTQPLRKARKRTSDEFEMDQSGMLVSKRIGSSSTGLSKDKTKEERPSARKHRSLNVSSSASTSSRDNKGRERRRESIGLIISSNIKPVPISAKSPERHSRQASTSAAPSSHTDALHSRRVHTTDFSHLPPSPSSSSIQQFLRHTTSTTSALTPPLSSREPQQHPSPNVAHSLLRGTQEGWSGLDDEATTEALRKLDGLTGKTARARASVGSFGRPASGSRPGTPPGKPGAQWEGIGPVDVKINRRSSGNAKDGTNVKEKDHPQRQFVGLGLTPADTFLDNQELVSAISSDEQPASSSAPDKTPKKAGTASARLSFTPKRGSTSSTTYGSTPTTSSRDSASMSTATSATSISAASGRHSTGRTKRNSAGSDVSSIHSNDATSLKDRVASLAVNGDVPEDGFVPPVPPLPKDLSTYRSPPPTSVTLTFPPMPNVEEKEKRGSYESDQDRTISLEVPPLTSPPHPSSPLAQGHRQSQLYPSGYTSISSASESSPTVLKTPSKKWSFSNALNLKLSSSPSSSSPKSGFPLSPRSVSFGQQLRKSTSKDQPLSPASSGASKSLWSPRQPDAMASAASLASLSSVGSVRTPALPSTGPSNTPDRATVPSRSGTSSSASTNHTTSALAAPQHTPLSPTSSVRRGHSTKRLTPSSIPFFRRSSSQSMQIPPLSAVATSSSSPTLSTGNISATHARFKASNSPPRDYNPPSTSVPGSAQKKSSVLSLGLPSLLKGSSSRRSLHADSKDAAKLEIQRAKDAARDAEKEKARLEKLEKEKQKKEDKDRSESRISVLMGRKRGKVC